MRGPWGAAPSGWQRTLGDAVYWLPQPAGSLPPRLGEWPSEGVPARSQAWLTRLATVHPLVLKAGWPGAPALAGRARGTESGQPGVNSSPRDHQSSEFLPPGLGWQPAGTSPIGGHKATVSRRPWALPPWRQGNKRLGGPEGLIWPHWVGGGVRGTPPPHSPSSADSSRHFHRRKFPEVRGGKRLIPFIQWVPPSPPPPNFLPPLPAPPCVNRKWRGKGSERSSWEQEAGSGRQAWCQPCPSWLPAGGPDPLPPGKDPAAGKRPSVRAPCPQPAPARVTCEASSAQDPAALATAAPPPPQAGHPELAGLSLGSRQSWHWLQPLGPASSLKLMQRFLFGAGNARAPPPPLFCRDHRSICCPMVGPLGSATREQHHKGPCWQPCFCGARLRQVEGGWWSEAGPGGQWDRSGSQIQFLGSWSLHLEYGGDYIQSGGAEATRRGKPFLRPDSQREN